MGTPDGERALRGILRGSLVEIRRAAGRHRVVWKRPGRQLRLAWLQWSRERNVPLEELASRIIARHRAAANARGAWIGVRDSAMTGRSVLEWVRRTVPYRPTQRAVVRPDDRKTFGAYCARVRALRGRTESRRVWRGHPAWNGAPFRIGGGRDE